MLEVLNCTVSATGSSGGGFARFYGAHANGSRALNCPCIRSSTPQLDNDRTVREVRAVHVVRYGRHSKPSAGRVLGTNEKPKTESADCERRHPGGNGIATQATEEPGGD